MSSTITPNTFTLSTVISPQALLITNRVQGQLDLRGKFGAMLNAAIARLSTTAYTNPLDLIVNRQFATEAGSGALVYSTVGGNSTYNLGRSSSLTGSGSTTRLVNTPNALADLTISTKTSNTGTTAYGSTMAFIGPTAPGSLTNGQACGTFELARTSGFTGSGPWTHTLSQPLGIVHAVGDYITDAADCWDLWLPGGFVYNVTFDAYNIATGAGGVVQAIANVYASDSAS
ncbi:MAG TPA: hypothetical protein VND64_19475 [Pirellulales bacterium]|nr:hypothetical protein [Pirellulales bacterium]